MSFPWSDLRQHVAELAKLGTLRVASDRKSLEAIAPDGTVRSRLVPPPCFPLGEATPAAWASALPASLGTMLVLLLRAGSAAPGVWRVDELLLHNVTTQYVVRGNGRAQTSYRKTKGKSRAGSRLRLRNAQSLLEETNDRLRSWEREVGGFARIHLAVPERLLADLYAADPSPPFAKSDPRLARIGMHVHEPRFEELLRVRRFLTEGRWIPPAPGASSPG